MDIGAFKLVEPMPEIRQPHLFLSLRPWIDVGSVGTRTLSFLQDYLSGDKLGQLDRPSKFYDFTRYRPQLKRVGGERIIEMPNTDIYYAKGPGDHDFVFVHALEPQNNAEDFLDSLLELVDMLKVARYCQIGSMYGSSPHTRPLTVTGQATENVVQRQLDGLLAIRKSNYEGPTSIMGLLTEQLRARGVSTMSMMAQLPPYIQLEEDRKGQETLLKLLDVLYKFSYDLSDLQRQGNMQYREIERAVQADSQTRAMVRRLEETYDAEASAPKSPETAEGEEPTSLSPELEQFLTELEKPDGQDN